MFYCASQRRINIFAFTLFTIIFSSCDNRDEQPLCEPIFLTSSTEGYEAFYYYDDNELMTALVSPTFGTRLDFSYDISGRLSVATQSYPSDGAPKQRKISFWHNDRNLLTATRSYDERGIAVDSMTFEHDASGRLSKRLIYKYRDSKTYLESYYVITYEGVDRTIVNFFELNPDDSNKNSFIPAGSFTYVLDDKKKPFPAAYYDYHLSLSNVVLSNNPLSLKTMRDGTVANEMQYTYTYDKWDRPLTQQFKGAVLARYSYACDPPRE